jgi:prophage regulatory protein
MKDKTESPLMILRRPEVMQMTGLSYSSIYRKMIAGEFPQRVQLGRKAVGWRRGEVIDWLENRGRVQPDIAAAA